ncbi:jg5575 [Pararge aegeria aegeria]|uniref:Jg5575 protein n=1 Tax=Pararge aegeria aegeria TaxID=348720 RepID=A0A8S4QKD3_9NEOP|nr:jg5575 [Pararge aegeria aegeria]
MRVKEMDNEMTANGRTEHGGMCAIRADITLLAGTLAAGNTAPRHKVTAGKNRPQTNTAAELGRVQRDRHKGVRLTRRDYEVYFTVINLVCLYC